MRGAGAQRPPPPKCALCPRPGHTIQSAELPTQSVERTQATSWFKGFALGVCVWWGVPLLLSCNGVGPQGARLCCTTGFIARVCTAGARADGGGSASRSAGVPGPSPGAPPPAQPPAGQEPLPAAASGLGGGGGSSLGDREAPAGPGRAAGAPGAQGRGRRGTGRQPLRFGGGGGEGRGQTVGGEAGEGRGGKSPERRTETFALSAGGQEKHPRRLIRGDGIRWGSLASKSGG